MQSLRWECSGMKCDFLELTAWQAASPRYFRRPFQPRKQHHERRF